MSRLASPATGCHLRLVEVQVGHQVEKYNATTFEQPLEFSLQGQRPLGAEIGTLLLIISTGSRQMLSLRLNDILNHPCGTEEPITIDKRLHEICVRLPNLDHTLRVWFQQSRDFLVSVCILRKTGFSIEGSTSSPLAKYGTRPLGTNLMANRATSFVHQLSLPNITPLQARDMAQTSLSNENAITTHENFFDEKAKFSVEESYASSFTKPNTRPLDANLKFNWVTSLIQQPSPSITTSLKAMDDGAPTSVSNEDSIASHENVFDEVLDRLSQTGRKARAISDWNFSTPNQPEDFSDMPIIHSCNAIAPNGTKGPTHPPLESLSYEKLNHRATSDSSKKHVFSEAADAPPFRQSHRYLTRSVSLAPGRLNTVNVNKESSRFGRKRGNRTKSTLTECLGNSQNKVTSSFDSDQIVDFRDLMPHRRSLPFLESKQRAHKSKQLRIDEESKSAPTRTPTNASDKTGLQALSVQSVWQTAEMMTLLMQVSTLDELETKSSALYKQYEQDVADGLENENRAAFYLDSLENIRTRFWLDQLEKVGGSLYERWAR
ncbi:hypothetical protein E4U56_003223 [Claviceps arundinis]|uniref:Uncharacterized protein n=1 Tax=Claviceps arundinis TaxID=1623583 RepID=A0A9P7MQ28_9HYPO|nr:hypothetical protein E4U56_003223 [Claviceps arundinis]